MPFGGLRQRGLPHGPIISLVVIPTAASVLWLLGDSLDEFSSLDVVYLLAMAALVLLGEAAVLLVAGWIAARRASAGAGAAGRYFPLVVALVGVYNIYHFLIYVLDAGRPLKNALIVAVLVLLGAAAYHDKIRRFAVAFFVLLCLMPWVTHLGREMPSLLLARSKTTDAPKQQPRPGTGAVLTGTRNVYLLGFDALISQPAYERLFRRDRKLPWLDVLRGQDFRVIEDAVSAGTDTRASFKAMLEMGQPVEVKRVETFFSGATFNPTYDLFRNNGYKVQFMFKSNYLGGAGVSRTIDFLYPTEALGMCEFLPPKYGLIACRPGVIGFVKKTFDADASAEEMEAILKDRIVDIGRSGQRWLSVTHFFTPAHTPGLGRYHYGDEGARKRFMLEYERNAGSAVMLMKEIVGHIRKHDPDAIMLIFGDHGALLTRGMEEGESNAVYTAEDVVLDRYGVTFAVFPADFCRDRFRAGYALANIMVDVVQCMSAPAGSR